MKGFIIRLVVFGIIFIICNAIGVVSKIGWIWTLVIEAFLFLASYGIDTSEGISGIIDSIDFDCDFD